MADQERNWFVGQLLTDYGPLKKGDLVFVRQVALKLSVGTCWWVRPKGQAHFWMVSEQFGGERLKFFARLHRHTSGELKTSPPDKTERLNEDLKNFTRGLHPMATPRQLKRSISNVPSSNPRRRSIRLTVNLKPV